MATDFCRARVLITSNNDLGGPGSEAWDLLSTDPGTIRLRCRQLCKARSKLLGPLASVVGYDASIVSWDGSQMFVQKKRNMGEGLGNPGYALQLGAGGDFPPLNGLANSLEAYGSLRSTAARGEVTWDTGQTSKTRLCFPWFLISRDWAPGSFADANNELSQWTKGIAAYELALRGGGVKSAPNNPFGRFHRLEFGALPANWADVIVAMQGGDGISKLGGILVAGNQEAKYPANTHVTVGGRRPGRKGTGQRGNDGGHYVVGQPGGTYDSSTGFTVVPLVCTVKQLTWDPCRTPGYVWPDKWEHRTVVSYESSGHGTTRRAGSRGRPYVSSF